MTITQDEKRQFKVGTTGWSVDDLDDPKIERLWEQGRYEIIEGELYVSRQPSSEHQYTCGELIYFLEEWNRVSRTGLVLTAPGLIFAEDDDVAPDVIWISRDRYAKAVDDAGHLHLAPELVIEVLSPSSERIDLGDKAAEYLRLPSLRAYLVFAQDELKAAADNCATGRAAGFDHLRAGEHGRATGRAEHVLLAARNPRAEIGGAGMDVL